MYSFLWNPNINQKFKIYTQADERVQDLGLNPDRKKLIALREHVISQNTSPSHGYYPNLSEIETYFRDLTRNFRKRWVDEEWEEVKMALGGGHV